MAGIGFRLQSLLAEDSYTSALKAYAYSGLIAAGPFVLTILAVSFIHFASLETLSSGQQAYFLNLITYGFAFSLVTLGASQLVITRYVADSYYLGHSGHFTALFFSTFAVNALFWGPWVLVFYAGLSVSSAVKLQALMLYLVTTGSWLALVFLSAAKDYGSMVRAFVIGALVSAGAAYSLGAAGGLQGYFGGFVLGQGVTFFLLASAVVREFGYGEGRDYFWLSYFRKYPRLAAIGLVYNLGIWIDKFLFWNSLEGRALDTHFRHAPVYDAPIFYAYLTVVPSLAYFLLQMETDFFVKYQAYYRGIENQENLDSLEKRRVAMVECLSYNLKRLVLLQGTISGLVLLIVPWITEATGMDPLQMGILRVGIFAAFLQAGVLIVINIILYFDLQREALAVSLTYCLLNGLLTYLSLRFGLPAYGYGYSVSCLIALALGFALLNERLRLLHYWTFVRQPLPRPVPTIDDDD